MRGSTDGVRPKSCVWRATPSPTLAPISTVGMRPINPDATGEGHERTGAASEQYLWEVWRPWLLRQPQCHGVGEVTVLSTLFI